MRTIIRFVAMAMLLAAPIAHAHSRSNHCAGVSIGDLDSPARWAPRRDSRLAHWHTTSRNGSVALLLTRGRVTFQLSDAAMRDAERDLRQAGREDEDEPALAAAFRSAVTAGVRVLLNHSAEVPVAQLEDVEYRNGELVFTSVDGERLFEDFEIEDQPLTRAFSELDAKAFVREFHRVKGTRRT